ncbi:MAG: UDP-N-acetylmuramate--L-alanine ligase, partial [Duodenibacillus sp.]|nr:UDP-N-acetylmuramate--L-alanine ligase [Duodenibacillus sp.]
RALARALRRAGQDSLVFCEKVEEMPQTLAQVVRDGDAVLTMGAGSIGRVPAQLQELMAARISGEEKA